MKFIRCSVLCVLLSFCSVLTAGPLNDLVGRLLPGYEKKFVFSVGENLTADEDFFELSSKNGKVFIKANNQVSAATGLNWYLKYYCHCSLSFCGDQKKLPSRLPAIEGVVRKSTPLVRNFYMNYCTFSYSTAYWDWERWEREIDLMALNGINTPMAMVGVEAVWRNTLREFDYSDKEIKEFLCGPAYFAWLLMSNLEGHGGPLPDEWFDRQIELQKKIVKRMREWGMTPVFQAFFGMVPNSLKRKYPESEYSDQGKWSEFVRPTVLLSTDPLFGQMAEVWYEEYEKLFGRTTCFGGDLFHEGGNTAGLDVAEVARGVQSSMLDYEPEAQWFIQCWGGNPRNDLLDGLDKKHTVIIDLAAEYWSRWKERKGFNGFPWVWSHVTNYGGNVGLHGRLDAIATGVLNGRYDVDASKSMIGTSATPEGIEINPVAFDLANEMRWRADSVDMYQWIKEYAHRRYGSDDPAIAKAWTIFYETVYGTYKQHRRPSESVFCAKPSLKGKRITASAWSQCKIFYNPDEFVEGVRIFLKSADKLKDEETYQYDAVDMVRQCLSDLGRDAYQKLVDAYKKKDKKTFEAEASRFLAVMQDQDELLSTHPFFHVSRWLAQARSASTVKENQDLYEENARQLIGTWTVQATNLRDYGHKEWGGMLKDYYYPRWNAYLDYLSQQLDGKDVQEPDLYPGERAWVESHNVYQVSGAHPVKTALKMFEKYYNK